MGSIYVVPHRRKREQKTDYNLRRSLLKSQKPRFVVRKSLKDLFVQLVEYSPKGDKVLFTVSGKDAKALGWKHSTSNIPSAYLIGLIAAKKAIEKKQKEGILDLGLNTIIKGSRLYAALKGIVDGGANVPHSKEIFPSDDRISGKHIEQHKKNGIEKDFESLKSKIMG